ncbi:hypothetical protein KY362_01220 [Candidatus Woesearchaeota archaeon]|nr:hypothetical protein [Candidatus Woesearchaeota archaeon]
MRRIILAALISLLVLFALLFTACAIKGGAVLCEKPYIQDGFNCCLDEDDDAVCDAKKEIGPLATQEEQQQE